MNPLSLFRSGMFEYDEHGKLSHHQVERIIREHLKFVYTGKSQFLHNGAPKVIPNANPFLDLEKDQFRKSWRETFNIGAIWIVFFSNSQVFLSRYSTFFFVF